jgi:hypothetical protein
MIVLVLAAFLTARVADFRAEFTDLLSELRATRHLSHGKGTYVGAAAVQLNAAGHHLDILLLQTRRRAVFTGLHALVAGFNAFFVFFVRHVNCSGWAVNVTGSHTVIPGPVVLYPMVIGSSHGRTSPVAEGKRRDLSPGAAGSGGLDV